MSVAAGGDRAAGIDEPRADSGASRAAQHEGRRDDRCRCGEHCLAPETVEDRTGDQGRGEDAEEQHQEDVTLLGEVDAETFAHLRQSEKDAQNGEDDPEDEDAAARRPEEAPPRGWRERDLSGHRRSAFS